MLRRLSFQIAQLLISQKNFNPIAYMDLLRLPFMGFLYISPLKTPLGPSESKQELCCMHRDLGVATIPKEIRVTS